MATLPGQSMYWGYVKAGGLSLRWMRDEVLRRPGDDALYAEYDRLAAAVPAGSDGVLFAPYLSGGNPDNPHASGTWLNMTAGTTVATLWRSMLESIAFEYADFLDAFARCGVGVDEVLAIGGGARSPLWNQIKADVVGIPWRTPTRQDGAHLADAALAAVAVGEAGDLAATIGSWVAAGAAAAPDAAAHATYARTRSVRSNVLSGPLRDVFAAIATLKLVKVASLQMSEVRPAPHMASVDLAQLIAEFNTYIRRAAAAPPPPKARAFFASDASGNAGFSLTDRSSSARAFSVSPFFA